MKESIGGTWLIGIVALFIVLFSAFMAYSINYTKAFRAKNGIIDLIEQGEGYTFEGTVLKEGEKSTQEQAYELVKSMGYDYATSGIVCDNDGVLSDTSLQQKATQEGGYCVYRICNGNGVRYKVVTYVMMEFPVINFGIKVPIKGETRTLYHEVKGAYGGSGNLQCDNGN